jgi:serine/threonine protein kinase
VKRLRERLSERARVSHGALATCFRARDLTHNRIVFLKVLNPTLASDQEMRRRFEREAQAVARLNHPHLVRLLEFGDDPDEGMYMMLEWVEGETLGGRFKRNIPFTTNEIHELARQLLIALSALHAVGVFHRDIKPENILICSDGAYKITDFSLAALIDSPRLTHHQAVVGTPAYMAPEQAIGKTLDARSDLFSVGVVLYEALTGGNPFETEDVIETLRRVRTVHPQLSGGEFDMLPQDILILIRSCLAKKIEERPANAAAALALLMASAPALRIRIKSFQRKATYASVIVFIGALVWILIQYNTNRAVFHLAPQLSRDSTAKTNSARTIADPLDPSASLVSPVHDTPNTQHNPQDRTVKRDSVSPVRLAITALAGRDTITSILDSTSVIFDVHPWAQIYFGHEALGTTPLRSPVRLPVGSQNIVFQNPAYPTIEVTFNLHHQPETLYVDLGSHVITLEFDINPWGNVFVEDEAFGPTPFNHPIFIRPGSHWLRISHPSLATIEREFIGHAGDTLNIRADLDLGQLAFSTRGLTSDAKK